MYWSILDLVKRTDIKAKIETRVAKLTGTALSHIVKIVGSAFEDLLEVSYFSLRDGLKTRALWWFKVSIGAEISLL